MTRREAWTLFYRCMRMHANEIQPYNRQILHGLTLQYAARGIQRLDQNGYTAFVRTIARRYGIGE